MYLEEQSLSASLEKKHSPAEADQKSLKDNGLRKWGDLYVNSLPAMVGFFAFTNPFSAAFEWWKQIPLENSILARGVTMAMAFAGVQLGVTTLRTQLYTLAGIVKSSESVKWAADTLYGAAVGAVLSPAFHTLTYQVAQLPRTTDFGSAVLTGSIVGAIGGGAAWLASDSFSYCYGRKAPSRWTPYAKQFTNLSQAAKRKVAAGTALASVIATLSIYDYRGRIEHPPNTPDSSSPKMIEIIPQSHTTYQSKPESSKEFENYLQMCL